MNLYGCLPSAFFSSANPVTYWTHAASMAGFPTSDSVIAPTAVGLNIKKSQMPLELTDVILKKRGVTIIRDTKRNDNPSSFRITTRCLSPPNGDIATPSASKNSPHLLHHNPRSQNQHLHLEEASSLYRKEYRSSSPISFNGLTSLQALCEADVSSFTSRRSISTSVKCSEGYTDSLKFGISRILSDDFGKAKKDKENGCKQQRRPPFPEQCPTFALCPCSSPGCTAYSHSHAVCSYSRALYPRAHHHHMPSLSAVHALQPPNYPMSSSVDALPGPYSILSTEANNSNQPKRKRSWSRAVFSNLQRKGLEKRFEVQKYVTKPDRRQLAAMLGLTDAQVKVWFQNRRMKWRHAQQQGDKEAQAQVSDVDANEQKGDKLNEVHHGKSPEIEGTSETVPTYQGQQKTLHLKTDHGCHGDDAHCDPKMDLESLESPPESPEIALNTHCDEMQDSEVAIDQCVNGLRVQDGLHGRDKSKEGWCKTFQPRTGSDSLPDMTSLGKQGIYLRSRELIEENSYDSKNGVTYITTNSDGMPGSSNSLDDRRSIDESIEPGDSSCDEDLMNGDEDSIMRDIDVEG